MTHDQPGRGRDALMRAGMWGLVAIAFANAVLHVRAVTMPLIASDYWTLLDPFLRNAFDGSLDLGDFLVKRAGIDHAQPLNKLLVLVNAHYFDLDFQVEALIGLVFGAAAVLVLYRATTSDAGRGRRPLAFHLLFAAIAGVFFSLNSSFIYAYSLVTMWFALYFFAFVMMYAAWHALNTGSWWPLLLATLAHGIVGDDSAILNGIAVSLALLAYGASLRTYRQPLRVIAAMLVVLLLCRLVYAMFGDISGATQAVFNQPLSARIDGLAGQWRDAWQWLAVPAASGIASAESLQSLFGEGWRPLQIALAVAVLAAHAWFWWSAWRLRPGGAWFMAISLMLLFYAHVAGILMTRVFVRGAAYLDQPRYVSFYQLGIVALLLMMIARVLDESGTRREPKAHYAFAAIAAALLLMQLPLSWNAWQREPYIEAYNQRMAANLAEIGRDPQRTPRDCAPAMDLCVLPEDKRVEWVRLLQQHRLSLYSEQFRNRHRREAVAAEEIERLP